MYPSLVGFGLAANNTVIFWGNLANFPNEQHGRILAAIMATGFLGTMLFDVVYTELFASNLSGYFTLIAVATGITFSIGVAFNVKIDSVSSSSYEPIEPKNTTEATVEKQSSQKPFWKSSLFYILITFCGIGYGVANAQLLLFSTQAESLRLDEYMAPILSISPAVSTIGVVIIGFLSDRCLDHFPRTNIYCFLNVVMAITLFVWIFFRDNLVMLIVLSVANGCVIAASYCLVLAELYVTFGEEAFAMTMGIFFFVGTSFVFISQFIASGLYELELKKQKPDDIICYGSRCFHDWTIIQTSVFAFCVLFNVIYICRKK